MKTNPKVSICIPVHAMADWKPLLERCLDSIIEQSFEDYEVVLASNKVDIEHVVSTYGFDWRIVEGREGCSANTNETIKCARGRLIKLMHMDDFFAHKHALKAIVDDFRGGWLVTPCDNNPHPRWTDDIRRGNNRIGGPSTVTLENKNPPLFDEKLVWLLDCDYYFRLHKKYGEPVFQKKVGIGIGIHPGQATNLIPMSRKIDEVRSATIIGE